MPKRKAIKNTTDEAKRQCLAVIDDIFNVKLSRDIDQHILCYVDRKTIRTSCTRVSKTWHKLVTDYKFLKVFTDNFMWERLAISFYEMSFPRDGYSTLPRFLEELGIAPYEGSILVKFNKRGKAISQYNVRWENMEKYWKRAKVNNIRTEECKDSKIEGNAKLASLVQEHFCSCGSNHKRKKPLICPERLCYGLDRLKSLLYDFHIEDIKQFIADHEITIWFPKKKINSYYLPIKDATWLKFYE
jgi:hypothetical protein